MAGFFRVSTYERRSLFFAMMAVTSLVLCACGGASRAAKTTPTATTVVCAVPTDGVTAYTSLDGGYKVTVPAGWSASCLDAPPFIYGIRATAPNGAYAAYILPASSSKIPAGTNGLQLFVQNQGPAFLSAQLTLDTVTPCCADLITFLGVDGVDVQYDLSKGGVASQAEFVAVAHNESPFLLLGLFPSVASGVENQQLQTMLFSSFAFLT